MMRKFLLDIVIAAIVAAMAFLVAAGPPPLPAEPAVKSGKVIPVVQKTSSDGWAPELSREAAALAKRNLFAENGSYELKEIKPALTIPENPYTLIAVLMGKEKKAVLRDFTGAVQTVPEGKKLLDGSVIAGMTPVSVKLKKGKETRELKVFDVRLMAPDSAKKEIGNVAPERRRRS